MAQTPDTRLRARLRDLGLSTAAINAAWPAWWSAEARVSRSAQAELAFTVARRLGLDARSLIEDSGAPRFLWRTDARFKGLSGEGEVEREGITSFGRAVAGLLINAAPAAAAHLEGVPASALRDQLLKQSPFIGLPDLLALAWAVGIPVVHLRVFPWPQKRMAAMCVKIHGRSAVLLARDSVYPAPIAFNLAHELGHIVLGHIAMDSALVELEDGHRTWTSDDAEENSANEFALELLTGNPRLTVLGLGGVKATGPELARTVATAATELRIDPGVLAEVFGFSTREWAAVGSALHRLYPSAAPVWGTVNALARRELDLSRIPEEAQEFLDAVLGASSR